MNRSSLFWFATALGVIIGIFLYFQYVHKIENFADTTTSTTNITSTPSTDDCPAGNFTEDTSVIPYQEKLKIYLSSFSTSDKGKKHKPYCASRQRWYDLKNPSVYFQVITPTPPADILNHGMPLKGVILKGPPSEFLGGLEVAYELKPFTLFFYASMKTPDFSNATEMVLFRLYAETPNSMRLVLRKSDVANSTRVDLIIGDYQHHYVWNITTTTLVSNGNPTLYGLTVDTAADDKTHTATLYIGRSKYTADIQLASPFKLGNTPMEINALANLDATLYSFGWIDHILTEAEMQRLGDYMYRQQTGVDREVSDTSNKAKTEAEEKITVLEEQLHNKTCPTEPPKEEESKKGAWSINVPSGKGAIARDTDMCPGLKIRDAVSDRPKTTPAPTASTTKKNPYSISYPANVVETMKDMAKTDTVFVSTTQPVEKEYKKTDPGAPLPGSSDLSKMLFHPLEKKENGWM